MATLKEFENVDNATNKVKEYRSKLSQVYQYLNRSVKKFWFDQGTFISMREYANDADAINLGGLKPGDLYSTPAGEVRVVK